jgi:glycogen debranching enzyme
MSVASRPDVGDIIEVGSQYYILATSGLADERGLVLKAGETFGLFDRFGDIKPVGLAEEGLFHEGTRFLSCLLLRVGQDRPLLLSSTVREDNALITVDLTNPDVLDDEGRLLSPRGTLHLSRTKCLLDGVCCEQLTFQNYGALPSAAEIVITFSADFADIFEVRGVQRERRGDHLPTAVSDRSVVLGYEGLDGVRRLTEITFDPAPAELTPAIARLRLALAPGSEARYDVTYACQLDTRKQPRVSFMAALSRATDLLAARRSRGCGLVTSNERFNVWINRSRADLSMMITDLPGGPVPYAGVPWFSAPFGRDAIITALACLWMNPDLARGVLSYLAAMQADASDAAADAQPGKILHERREGEMAALGEIPFGRYYGSHDATPLFVVLAAAHYRRTADAAFARALWPHVERALAWIDREGDPDGDGFFEYYRRSATGLDNQGWKDSQDSVFHADGRLAEGPIALCEVQGYVYAAWLGAAELASVCGDLARAERLTAMAEALRRRIEERFWSDAIGTYALALDGDKESCVVRTSNAGHVLFAGAATPARAAQVARTLLDNHSFSGWGIRTVASSESRYNPMSYHNGSIWPHDNALVAAGFARYGLQDEAIRVLDGLFDASLFVHLRRLPELFCGFTRRAGESPTLYPVACAPQSWAAAAVFLLLQATLGMEIDAPGRSLRFRYPRLPPFLDRVHLSGLTVGDAALDLVLERQADSVGINVLRRTGRVEVITLK